MIKTVLQLSMVTLFAQGLAIGSLIFGRTELTLGLCIGIAGILCSAVLCAYSTTRTIMKRLDPS